MKYNFLSKYDTYNIILKSKSYVSSRKMACNLILIAYDKYKQDNKIGIIAVTKEQMIIFYNDLVYKTREEMQKQIKEFNKEGFDVITTFTSRSAIQYEKNRKILYK